MQRFTDLQVWQKGHALALKLYGVPWFAKQGSGWRLVLGCRLLTFNCELQR